MAYPFYDAIIIGGGVIGCAAARELSRYRLALALLEKKEDVACGTSKANSGIIHAGFDAATGSMKARYNAEGNAMFDRLSQELGFPFRRNGSLVLCFEGEDDSKLFELLGQGRTNGIPGLEILTGEEVRKREPSVSGKVTSALYAPTGGIAGPYEMTIAYAENAAANGVDFFFGRQVVSIVRGKKHFEVTCADGSVFFTEVILNAAGLHADEIHNMVCGAQLKIIPRRGEYCLYDKSLGERVRHTLFQLPSEMGKGILVTPTTHGNLLIGPTAVDIEVKDDFRTTHAGLSEVFEKAVRSVPVLSKRDIITQFSGLRAHLTCDDFVVGESAEGFFDAAGIESPGLTSAPAIAVDLANQIAAKLKAGQNESFNPYRAPIAAFSSLSYDERMTLIESDPRYGQIVCRCENVTEGEIVESIRRVPGARSLDGVKRRTRAGMGRCQAGFCSPRVLEILARELSVPLTAIAKSGEGSEILICRNKEGE